MKNKDPNYAVKVEQAIAKKYGDETVVNPKFGWDDKKEKEYLEQSTRSCPVCNTYSFKSNDDVYMTKFECCFKCYTQWVEGREDRWKNGWRPNK